MSHKFKDPDVEAVFETYPTAVRDQLETLRALIFSTAAETDGVGGITETLKWGQPSYLTAQSKSGSTIRIDQVRGDATKYAMFFHCQSGLVPLFAELYEDELVFEDKRGVVFDVGAPLNEDVVRHCVALALTHHLRKKAKSKVMA